jgi:hypothetical protein
MQDTIVYDPFYHHMPAYFNLSFKELLAAKHPTAWIEFERGLISEADFLDKFFADGRAFDGPGLVQHMVSSRGGTTWGGGGGGAVQRSAVQRHRLGVYSAAAWRYPAAPSVVLHVLHPVLSS